MTSQHNFYRCHGKRALDSVLAALALLILAPVFVIIAVGVKLDGRGPVFYRQPRVGRGGRIFSIVKFRSMLARADRLGPGITAADDCRITGIGRFLRKWKLDELPQLWNVLRGDMSLVGPRPELLAYVKDYSQEQKEVLTERPGVTDLASIEYRHEEDLLAAAGDRDEFYRQVALPHKLLLGRKYIEHISFRNDCRIILRTVTAICSSREERHRVNAMSARGETVGQNQSKINGNT